MELKTQLETAKESLLYLQKRIEGELSLKLMGRESMLEEFSSHLKETKASFRELFDKITQLSRWKDNFNEVFNKSTEYLNRRVENCVSQTELSKYNEELIEVINLKVEDQITELTGIRKKLKDIECLEDKVADTSTKLNSMKTCIDLLEDKVKDSVKKSDNENQYIMQREYSNKRMEAMEEEFRAVKEQCEKLAAKNKKLEKELSDHKSESNRQSEYLRAELLEKITELKNAQNKEEGSAMNEKIKELEEEVHENTRMISEKVSRKEVKNIIQEIMHEANSIPFANSNEIQENEFIIKESQDKYQDEVKEVKKELLKDDLEEIKDQEYNIKPMDYGHSKEKGNSEILKYEVKESIKNNTEEEYWDDENSKEEEKQEEGKEEEGKEEEGKEEEGKEEEEKKDGERQDEENQDEEKEDEERQDEERLQGDQQEEEKKEEKDQAEEDLEDEDEIEGLGEALVDDINNLNADDIINDLVDAEVGSQNEFGEDGIQYEDNVENEQVKDDERASISQHKELRDIADASDDDWFK